MSMVRIHQFFKCRCIESDKLQRILQRCRPQLVKGFMQLYSVEQKRSQALEAHAAAFSTLQASGARRRQSIVISFAQKTLVNGTINSKLHVIELGAQPGQLQVRVR